MQQAQKFYPTWRGAAYWGAATAVGAAAAAVVVPFAIGDGASRRILLAAAGLFFASGVFAVLLRHSPVKVTPEGVFATRGFSVRSRLVRWREIKAVVPTTASGLRQLRLVHDSPFPEQIDMPMHLDDLTSLREFVAAHAGEHHPLAVWLSGEMSASNKAPELTHDR